MNNHGYCTAKVLPEKFRCKGKSAKDFLFKKPPSYKNLHKHESFQYYKKGNPVKVVNPDMRLIEIRNSDAYKKHKKLYGCQDSLYFCPYRCISSFKLFRCVTRHKTLSSLVIAEDL